MDDNLKVTILLPVHSSDFHQCAVGIDIFGFWIIDIGIELRGSNQHVPWLHHSFFDGANGFLTRHRQSDPCAGKHYHVF